MRGPARSTARSTTIVSSDAATVRERSEAPTAARLERPERRIVAGIVEHDEHDGISDVRHGPFGAQDVALGDRTA